METYAELCMQGVLYLADGEAIQRIVLHSSVTPFRQMHAAWFCSTSGL